MVRDVYDRIAKHYHLLFNDWEQVVEGEERRLDNLFRPRGVRSVLDCTCGIGLQGIVWLSMTVRLQALTTA